MFVISTTLCAFSSRSPNCVFVQAEPTATRALPHPTACTACGDEPARGGDDDDASSEPGLSIGDLLVEVLARQRVALPLEEQLDFDRGNLDAMLASASVELDAAYDELGASLAAVSSNTSATLVRELDATQMAALNELARVRRASMPGRRAVQTSLRRLRDEQAERDRLKRLAEWEPASSRDPWWTARLAMGGRYARVVEQAASALGVLLLLAAIDALSGTFHLAVFLRGVGGEARALLVFTWRLAFAGGGIAYFGGLLALTQPGLEEDGRDP